MSMVIGELSRTILNLTYCEEQKSDYHLLVEECSGNSFDGLVSTVKWQKVHCVMMPYTD